MRTSKADWRRLSICTMLLRVLVVCIAVLCVGRGGYGAGASARTELASGWRLISASNIADSGALISQAGYDAAAWYPIHQMPATVLQILEEDGVYPNLYFGMNLLTEVPQDLYKQDWWYRTTFAATPGAKGHWLELPGINYRAEVWLNGQRLADSKQLVGMYVAHEFNITELVKTNQPNVLAIKVTPERAIPDVTGVELGDSWHDWLDWKFLGSKAPESAHYKEGWTADRNAGVWKPVYLRSTGAVKISGALVNTVLPLPKTDRASLTVFATASNGTHEEARGRLIATITRAGKTPIHLEQTVRLAAEQTREIAFDPHDFAQLELRAPDLWWPYTMGSANLYDLQVEFIQDGHISDAESIQFGIRQVTQHRDNDLRFSKTNEGNFYLKVNGKDFAVRGADYTPDLLFARDPERDEATIRYVKDLGLNMLRWELKLADEHMFELADREGIPVMAGWMCCPKWEQWKQWSDEDQYVARASLDSQIQVLRSHSSVFLWSNGSDGRPPEPLRTDYRKILQRLHWQNAVVDTDANGNKDANGKQAWDGIGMEGVDRWHPPSYWFDPKYPASGGSTAEYGDNEIIPPYESLKKFIPEDKLWPINEFWSFHAGAHEGNNQLSTIRQVVDRRYGPSSNAEEFARKAQLAHYETTRAQFEDWAVNGWDTHKIEMYWMLNNHWPSFFGHLFDYYMEQGGGYFGAKKALRPLSVVFDYYMTPGHTKGNVSITNQTMLDQNGLRVRVRIYDLTGKVVNDVSASGLAAKTHGVTLALSILRPLKITPAYFIRCELFDANDRSIVDNVYWQSTTLDDFGDPLQDDDDYAYSQASWSDFKALNTLPEAPLAISGTVSKTSGKVEFSLSLHNNSKQIAFFERASIIAGSNGNEVLPILYSDNYVTVFPGETSHVEGSFDEKELHGSAPWLRVEGYNTAASQVPLQ